MACAGKVKGSQMKSAMKELKCHIAKMEARHQFKFPYAPPKTPIDLRKMYIRVKEDEPEDLLSDVESDAEQVPDSPDEVLHEE
jgi:hypothetical protein